MYRNNPTFYNLYLQRKCLILVICINKSLFSAIWWASVVFYMLAKMCSSYGVFSMHVVAMEVFPTTSRNSLTNIANTFGRIGSVLAPQTPLLVGYIKLFTQMIN